MSLVIGIDNGLDGGLVALSALAGVAPVAMARTPCKTPRGGREVDTAALIAWILNLRFQSPPLFVLEECPHHSRDKAAMRSMAFTAGKILGALEGLFPVSRIVLVASGNAIAGWQRAICSTVAGGSVRRSPSIS